MLKRKMYRVLLIWILLLIVSALIGKSSIASDNGGVAADFLNIGVGARAAALGGAFTSVVDDASASYWNPSGLGRIGSTQFVFSHFAWYQDISYEYLALAYPVSDRLTLAVSTSYLSYGTIEGYDRYDNPTGELGSTYDLAAGFSLGCVVTEEISIGLTAKYIMLSLADLKASAFAADFGALYNIGDFTFGLAAVNIGQDIKFNQVSEKLPSAIRIGVSTYALFGSPSLEVSLDIEKRFHGNLSIRNGFEWIFEERYFIRTGYAYQPDQDGREFGQSLSLGAGALLGPARFDYTFSPREKFSSEDIHRFSIILGL